MFRKGFRKVPGVAAILTIFCLGLAGTAMASSHTEQTASLSKDVAHLLILLPYYGVFDNLAFTIKDGDTVVLTGQVVNDIVKSNAEAAVRSIAGVGEVINEIEVLPLSRFDHYIRLATYRAIYSKSGFEKYAIRANQPIKIIVKNGNVTLDGFVQTELEKTVARLAANSVPGVFSVTDNLKIG